MPPDRVGTVGSGKRPRWSLPIAAFAFAIAIGLFSGLAAGPVVGPITTLVSSIGVAVIARDERPVDEEGRDDGARPSWVARGPVLAAFAVALAPSLLAGIYVRNHQWLAPTVSDRAAALRAAGFDATTSRWLAVGLLPSGQPVQQLDGPLAEADLSPVAGLFASGSTHELCEFLRRHPPSSADELAAILRREGGTWRALLERVEADVPDLEARHALLYLMWESLCPGEH